MNFQPSAPSRPAGLVTLVIALTGVLGFLAGGHATEVNLLRIPNGGIQPQVVVDAKRVVHIVYLGGEPKAADVFYVRLEPGQKNFPEPLQVNHERGSAIALGTIRGAQLALGRNGRV